MSTIEAKLPDSGATIRVRRVSPATIMALDRAYPDPKPPLQEVDYGNGSHKKEPNPHDPAYLGLLEQHQRDKSMLVLRAYIRLGVEVEIDQAALQAYRENMTLMGIPLSDDDKYVYVANILCETNDDLTALREAIEGRSIPTEQAVADKADSFPGDVPQS